MWIKWSRIVWIYFCNIFLWILSHRKKNKDNTFTVEGTNNKRRDPKSVYQIPKPAGETYDHVYAETTEVYHPYLELIDDGFSSLNSSENLVKSPSNQNSLATPTIGHRKSNGMANNSTVMLTVDDGYIEPARTPNFGRKLPQIPSEQTWLSIIAKRSEVPEVW